MYLLESLLELILFVGRLGRLSASETDFDDQASEITLRSISERIISLYIDSISQGNLHPCSLGV